MDFYHFNSYSAEDFIMDEHFLEIVNGGFVSIEDFKDHIPLKRWEIDLAVEMLTRLRNMEFQQAPERKFEQWNAISGKLDLTDNPDKVLDGLVIISKIRYFKQENKYVFL